jgi:hypothetical protein
MDTMGASTVTSVAIKITVRIMATSINELVTQGQEEGNKQFQDENGITDRC